MRVELSRPLLAALVALIAGPLAGQSKQSDPEWVSVRPGGETGCAFGTPFEFWVREGDPSRILIYLQGGGACWSFESCDPHGAISFDPAIDSTDFQQRRSGIFDRSATLNPFRHYTQIFVPYCTGDFHLGTREVRYTPPGADSLPAVVVKQVGYRNLQSVAAYLSRRKTKPSRIVVSGGSAGAIASPILAGAIAGRLGSAEVIQIGDGVAGIHNVKEVKRLTAVWGADSVLRSLGVPVDSASDLLVASYRAVAGRHPQIHFSQIATESDAVAGGWLRRFGYDPARLPQNIQSTYADLGFGLCFNGYSLPGVDHTILWRPQFLTARNDRGLLVEQLARDVIEHPCAAGSARSPGDAAFLFSYRPRPEHADSFVAGYRRHLAWHAEHHDSLTWLAWNVVDGREQGIFVDGTFGIAFAAFDARVEPGADGADFVKNVAPHVDPLSRETFRLRRDLSLGSRLEQNRAAAFSKVVRITVRPGEIGAFEQAALAVRGVSKSDYSLYQRVSGGEQSDFLLIVQLDAWADLQNPAADPSVMLVRRSTAIAKAESAIWSYQPSLTYSPTR